MVHVEPSLDALSLRSDVISSIKIRSLHVVIAPGVNHFDGVTNPWTTQSVPRSSTQENRPNYQGPGNRLALRFNHQSG